MKFLIILVLAILCQAQKTNRRNLNKRLNRLTRETDVLQKNLSVIWTIISNPGNFEQMVKGAIEKGKGTMNDVKELKTEVKQLILHSRIGFANEKEFQREAISDLKRSYRGFETGMIEENTQIKHNVDRLNNQVLGLQETSKNLQETSKDNQLRIETVNLNLNENVNEIEAHSDFLDSLLEKVEVLSTIKQNKLEIENRELKQTISNMKSDHLTQYRELKQTISNMKSEHLTQYRELKQTISNMKSEHLTQYRELKQTISNMKSEPTMLPLIISCDEDWTLFNGHCYLYIRKKRTWDVALAACKYKDSYLVEITSESEFEFVAGMKIWSYGRIWIGATDEEHEGNFVYQKSKQAVPTKFWNVGEPNNDEGKEDCVEMVKLEKDYKFNDVPCDFVWPFVCEKKGMFGAE